MFKYRAEITKDEEIRYISHLDYASLWQRAICRAKLPAAYSEGFNPHMKMAFASALAVGVTSLAEYMDFELQKPLCQPEVFDRLTAQLPKGVRLLRLKEVQGKHKALMAEVELARYEIVVPYEGPADEASKALEAFKAAGTAIYNRVTPKKTREIDAKAYVSAIAAVAKGNDLCCSMSIRITPTGSIKPGEVLSLLADRFDLHIATEKALICRTALWGQGKPLIDLV